MQEWPADQVERWPLARLVPHVRNARTHSAAQVEQIAASIREWGWTTPVLADEGGSIIAGHGRVMAAAKIGLAEVPVMVARGWSDAQKRAYMLADNQLALNAAWDSDMLKLELTELRGGGFDLGLIGFDGAELADIFAEPKGKTDADDVPEPEAVAVARLGDVWRLGRHVLACGDCTDPATVDAALAGAKPHLMVTDPPYGVNYDPGWRHDAGVNNSPRTGKVLNDDRADWREAWALFPGAVAYVWHGALHAATVAESLQATGFEIRSQIIWAKESLVMGRGHYHWQHEPCWYAARGTAQWNGDRKQTTLWQIATRGQDAETTHGTQKPVECMRRPIENNSRPGDAVYEPFSGSGTTIIAAEQSGRACHAVELNPLYCDVAIRPWEAFTGETATLAGDGRSFGDIAATRVLAAA